MSKSRFVREGLVRAHSGRAGYLLAREGGGASMESLEPRQLLTAISWDGGAGDNLWHSAANWSGDVVPTSADDVTIDIAATPTILLNGASGNRAVNSLILRENLTISGGSTLTLGTSASVEGGAVLALNNGRLSGGTWTSASTSLGVDTSPGNTISGLTWNGGIALSDASDRLVFGTGVTLNGTLTASAANAEVGAANNATLTGEIAFPGSATGRRIGPNASNVSFSIAAGATVHGGGFTIGTIFGGSGWSNTTLTNLGSITADVAGQTITINTTNFTSTGTLNVGPGNMTISPGNTWATSGGTVNVSSGTLTIDGTYNTAAGIGTWSRTGGTVNVAGTISNAGNTLTLNAATGTWDLTGGAITGGTLALAAGGGLGTNSSGANRLTGIIVNGDITLADANDRLSLGLMVTLNGVVTLSGTNAELGLVNGAVLNSEVAFPGSTTGRRIGPTSSSATFTFGPSANIHGGSLTIGTIYGGSGWSNITAVNQGIISAEVAGQTITINTTNFTSTGTLNVGPGSMTISPGNTWSTNGGTVNVSGGTLTIDGTFVTASGIGTWSRTGGNVSVTGTIDNTGGILNLNTATGTWDLVGGTITGGTVNILAGGGLGHNSSGANRLSNLTFNGDITLADANDRLSLGLMVTLNGVISLSGVNTELGLVNGAVLNTEVSFPGTATGRRIGPTSSSATFTFGPSANLHGGSFTIGTIYGGSGWSNVTAVNQGTISAELAGQTITINTTNFTSTGTLNIGPGSMTISPGNTWSTNGSTVNVSGGTLTIDGTFVTGAGIGTWNRTGGTVNVSGTIDNTGGTLNLGTTTGTWDLTGGTITGGTVNILAGGGLGYNSSGANRLSNLTFNGDITLADANDRLSLGQNVTINGVISLSGVNTELGLVNGSVLNTEVTFPGTASGRRIGPTSSSATFTFGPSANLHGGSFTIGTIYGGSGWSNITAINQGTITAEVAGQTITINTTNFTSAGTINIGPGSMTISPGNTWSTNGGTVNVSGGTLTIDGTFVTASGIGTWNRTGGTVSVTGTIDNTGGILNLNTATGTWDLVGGTITGGTVNIFAGGGLGYNSSGANRLSNLTFNGDITLADATDRLSLGQNVIINGVTTLSGTNSELGLVNGAVLNSEVVFPGTATGRRIGPTSSNSTFTFGPSANLHGGSFTIGTIYGGSGWSNITAVNQGTISAEVAGQTITINTTIFTGMGTLNVGPGNMTVVVGNTWTINTSTINVSAGTLTLDGTLVTAGGIGTWNRTGGTVNVAGTIDNTNGTLILNATTGTWELTGGVISAGTVNLLAGGGLGVNASGANRLSGLTLNGNLTLGDATDRLSFAGAVTVNGVISVTGTNAEVGIANNAVVNAEITFPGNVAGRRIGPTSSNSVATLGPAANVHGGTFIIGTIYGGSGWSNVTFVNQGRLIADEPGRTVTVSPTVFINTGTAGAGTGIMTIAPAGMVPFSNAGTIEIGPGGRVNVTGTYTQESTGRLLIKVGGPAATDIGRLVVSDAATLDGTLEVQLVNGFNPACMNSAFLDASSVAGQFSSAILPPPPGDHQSLVVYFGNQVRFAISPPSDFNLDGVLNSQDFFDFLQAFFANNADYNHDGTTNSQDFFDFLQDFFEGC